MVGAERLTSSVYKTGEDLTGFQYRFNIVCLDSSTGRVTHWLGPDDLEAMVKLTRVLAAELAEDGCLARPLRQRLRIVAAALDETIDLLSDQHTAEKH